MTSSSVPLNPDVLGLVTRLRAVSTTQESGPVYHVEGVGSHFYFAYEQLRNAADYRERHLLLRSAIERYLTRSLEPWVAKPIGADLVTELTQAGYLPNHTVPLKVLSLIDEALARQATYLESVRAQPGVDIKTLRKWAHQLLSVELADQLVPSGRRLVPFVSFTQAHFRSALDPALVDAAGLDAVTRSLARYCAVHRAIFKSDLATARYYYLTGGNGPADRLDATAYIKINAMMDRLYDAPETSRLSRMVSRHGAPLRILRELFVTGDPTAELLHDPASFRGRLQSVCSQQYALAARMARERLGRTILFIFLTKVLIGVAIEVPYDVVTGGAVVWSTLAINVAFPALYLLLIGLRPSIPGRQNTTEIVTTASRIVYDDGQPPLRYRRARQPLKSGVKATFNLVYAAGFLLSFAFVIWGLYRLGFNIVGGAIFIVFFSAVSFLGFRLRQVATELRLVPERQSLPRTVLELVSAPFIQLGQWLTDRYARLNIVTRVLDTAIELPLKTSLRMIQQWSGFVRDRNDNL